MTFRGARAGQWGLSRGCLEAGTRAARGWLEDRVWRRAGARFDRGSLEACSRIIRGWQGAGREMVRG